MKLQVDGQRYLELTTYVALRWLFETEEYADVVMDSVSPVDMLFRVALRSQTIYVDYYAVYNKRP